MKPLIVSLVASSCSGRANYSSRKSRLNTKRSIRVSEDKTRVCESHLSLVHPPPFAPLHELVVFILLECLRDLRC